jgi:hypothetical protein
LSRVAVIGLAIGLALIWVTSPSGVRAECTTLDRWPEFRAVAPLAASVVVGEVVEDRDPSSSYLLNTFGFRVDTVLRGSASVGSVIEIANLPPGPPPIKCSDTHLRALLGDVVALAMDAPGPNGQSLNSAAWLRGEPDAMQRGLSTTTWSQLRAIFDLPATDTRSQVAPTQPIPWVVLLVALGAGGWLAWDRRSRVIHPR